jgi:SlyX protein
LPVQQEGQGVETVEESTETITKKKEKAMEQRLTEMEMLIMHQGRVIDQLNEVVTIHQSSIDRLTMELKLIKDHLRGLVSSENRLPSEEEPPPHY